jgi:Ca-activated chloride channel family protein
VVAGVGMLALLLWGESLGQNPPGPDPRVQIVPRARTPASADLDAPRTTIRVDTTLVLIPVTVTDPSNRIVTGLDKDYFQLQEDNLDQDITHFASEDTPISVGIVFDTSGSMGDKLQKSRQAVAQFSRTANPADEFFLVQFNTQPELTVGWVNNTDELQNHIMFSQSRGTTALLDAVYLALNQMKKAHNPRKAILIISDGGDNNSRYTESELKNVVREADVQIYGIGIYEAVGSRGRTPEELSGPSMLSEIANQTGGRVYQVGNLGDLPDIAAKIGIELRNQYVLGYSPTNRVSDGKYRRVKVKLIQPRGLPPLRAYWRLGYYAPSQ